MTARGWIVQLLAISIYFSTHHHHHGSKTSTTATATATTYPPAAAKQQQQQQHSPSSSSSSPSTHEHQATIMNMKKQVAAAETTTSASASAVDFDPDSDTEDETITEITILKIGGSSITNKALEETLNHDALHWFSKLVANSIDSSFLSSDNDVDDDDDDDDDGDDEDRSARAVNQDQEEIVSLSNRILLPKPSKRSKRSRHLHQFIVVHGAGSFGHHSAKRYGLKCGKATFLEELGGITNQQQQQHHQDNVVTKRRRTLDSLADEDTTITPSPTITTTFPKMTKQKQQKQQQKRQRYQMQGLVKTRQSVQKLNAACVSSLIEHGVNAIGISPGMTYHRLRGHGATGRLLSEVYRTPRPSSSRHHHRHRDDDDDSNSDDGDYHDDTHDGDDDSSSRGMRELIASVKRALHSKIVPVLHGDACLLRDLSAGILGGDTLAEGIAACWNDVDDVDDDGKREGCSSGSGGGGKTKIARVIFITDVGGVYTSDPNSTSDDDEDNNDRDDDDNNGGAELIRCISVDGDTGELRIDNKKKDGTTKREGRDGMHVGGSSHSHDVTGGLKAKLGAAVAIARAGIDVIISKCGTDSTETFVNGNWHSIYDVEEGTLLSSSTTHVT